MNKSLNIINIIWDSLSNREIALLAWLLFFLLVIIFTSLRKPLYKTIKSLFSKVFLKIYFLIFIYITAIIYLLFKLNLWSIENLKDTFFWIFSIGAISVFNITDAKDINYFRGIFFSTLKWTLILEFIINFYSFSLIIEIFLSPILLILTSTQLLAKDKKEYKEVASCLGKVIAIIMIGIFIYSLCKTIENLQEMASVETLISLFLPSTLTILFLPFLYLLSLYVTYESYFIRLNFITYKKNKIEIVKKRIIITANFNLNKLKRIEKRFDKRVFYDDTDLKRYIFQISKKKFSEE